MDILNNNLGGWPILNGNSNEHEDITIVEKLINLRKIDALQLFEIFVSLNPKDPKKYVLRVDKKKLFNYPNYI